MAAYLDTTTDSWAGLSPVELTAAMAAKKEAARKVGCRAGALRRSHSTTMHWSCAGFTAI